MEGVGWVGQSGRGGMGGVGATLTEICVFVQKLLMANPFHRKKLFLAIKVSVCLNPHCQREPGAGALTAQGTAEQCVCWAS